MSVDYTAKLNALRELYERVKEKDASIPKEMYDTAGVKQNARLKDIEKEISTTKKKVSSEIKKITEKEIEDEYAALAKEHNMTVEEFKETVVRNARPTRLDDNHAEHHAAMRKERAGQRELKEKLLQAERGDFDMAVDYV
ncbi:hypothetical protein JKF63_06905 [Porcisia hertigi]|uniref:Uncharacterized protein n=1 Tax=Porcisia hertigi TaxID=2761500 RepID=A0A836LJC2_9TRYP|nr:hypothetical protein JKF63_06905 [Porcisia hertigi]